MKINPQDVTVEYFNFDRDIEALCQYFYHSPPGFMESIGLNMKALGDEKEFRTGWRAKIDERTAAGLKPTIAQSVFYRGELVGVHTATHWDENKSVIMHAHFYHKKFRGKGIGTISYVKAMENLLRDLSLQEVVFKTPIANAAPMKIKEKLGLEAKGEEVLDWPTVLPGTRAKVFRVDLAELKRIKKRVGLA